MQMSPRPHLEEAAGAGARAEHREKTDVRSRTKTHAHKCTRAQIHTRTNVHAHESATVAFFALGNELSTCEWRARRLSEIERAKERVRVSLCATLLMITVFRAPGERLMPERVRS